jgi:hypothetical protein
MPKKLSEKSDDNDKQVEGKEENEEKKKEE